MIRSTSSFNAVRRIIGICEFSARMSRQISRPDPSGNITSSTINLMSFDSSATLRLRLWKPVSPEIPAQPDTGQAAFVSERHHRRSGCAIRRALAYVLIETASDGIEQLSLPFNEEAVKSPFTATLRHNAAAPEQRSDMGGPNLENSGALKPRHFGSSIAAQSEKPCLVLLEAESAFSSGFSSNCF